MEIKKVLELAKELNLEYEVYEKDYYFYLPHDWIRTGVDYMPEDEDDRESFFVWRHNNKHVAATLNIVIDADFNIYYNDGDEYSTFTEFEQRVRKLYGIISQLQEMRKKMKVQMNIEKIKSDFN